MQIYKNISSWIINLRLGLDGDVIIIIHQKFAYRIKFDEQYIYNDITSMHLLLI